MKHVTLADPAQLDLSFVRRNGRTVLDRRLFSYPFVLMRTFSGPSSSVQHGAATRSEPLTFIVQNSGGPIHDRDDLATRLSLGEATRARAVYQGATAIHRARPGHTSRERLSITLAPHSQLDYLPAPRILFPDAAHQQHTEIELNVSSTMLFIDAFSVHDPAGQGRPFRELDNRLTIRRDGELVLLDRQRLINPLFGNGYRAFGTMLMIGHPAPKLPEIPGLYAAMTQLPANLGWACRLAAPNLDPIRNAMAQLSQTLSPS